MSDWINRQAALDDMHRQIWYRMNQQGMKDRVDEWLKNLPAAELDASEWQTDNGYMWLCPSCGLALHSDFDECVRCGNKRPEAESERKKGKWKRHNTYHGDDTSGFVDPDWRCSECGKQATMNEWMLYYLSNFCPNCGAKMEEQNE